MEGGDRLVRYGLLGGYDGWGCAAASLVTLGTAYALNERRSNEDN